MHPPTDIDTAAPAAATSSADLATALAVQAGRIDQLERQVAELAQALTLRPAAAAPVPARVPKPAAMAAGPRRLNVLIMGARGHGSKHIASFGALADCRIAYICDVDSVVAAEAAALVESKTGDQPKIVQDLRDALSDPGLDIVSIATPHHWHALAAIWALQAGKHVYIEKPLGHTHAEGESILAAARKYGRVVQFGTQLRSNGSLMAASKYMREGRLGEVGLVHCVTFKPRPPLPLAEHAVVPKSVNHDLWSGPAPLEPPSRSRFHYHWHWFWDFGNGALGNNGIHRIDVARIGLGLQGLGDSVLSYGGRYGPADGGQTPNTQIVMHRFDKTWVVQEVRGMPTKATRGVSNGILFFGKRGTIAYKTGGAVLRDLKGVEVEVFPGKQENHYRNFLDAVQRNDGSQLTGDLYEGHLSSSLCHLGNISHRLGVPADDTQIDAASAALGAPPNVRAFLPKLREHMTANGASDAFTLGRALQVDIARQPVIVGDAAAAALLTRSYRAPYAVPAPDAV
jgi:predicted dehydrogenase